MCSTIISFNLRSRNNMLSCSTIHVEKLSILYWIGPINERLASMKSSACGHYSPLFPWTFGFDEIISLRSILFCFLERLASMKSSACGQYFLFPWTFGFDEIISLRSILWFLSLNVWLRWNHQPAVNIMLWCWFHFDEIIQSTWSTIFYSYYNLCQKQYQ